MRRCRRFARRHALSLLGAVGSLLGIVSAHGQTTASWLTPTSGFWSDGTKWSTSPVFPNNGQPAAADTYNAVIAAIGGSYTVTLNGPVTVNSLTLNSPNATFRHDAGTLTLLNGAQISGGAFQLVGGTIAGGGTINVDSVFNWD